MAKIGIVVDNYKVRDYRIELDAANIHYIMIEDFPKKGVTTLKAFSEVVLLQPLIERLERHFRAQSN